jgi:hypothetical protein
MNNTIAIDFDGTIHAYSKGWDDGSIYDHPTEGCFEALQQLYKDGYELVIYTCRANNPGSLKSLIEWMEHWQISTFTKFEYKVTSMKPVAKCYIDDRGIRFTNWKDMLGYF